MDHFWCSFNLVNDLPCASSFQTTVHFLPMRITFLFMRVQK